MYVPTPKLLALAHDTLASRSRSNVDDARLYAKALVAARCTELVLEVRALRDGTAGSGTSSDVLGW